MSRTIYLTAPFITDEDQKTLSALKAGDRVLLSGEIYTARDAAHKKMIEALDEGEPLPFAPQGAVIYYVGPTPPPPGFVIGSAGPTTASRMDAYTPRLLNLGIKAVIGKGYRSDEVRKSLVDNKAVYFQATGGAGSLLARTIKASEMVAWPELGTEAVRRFTVKDLPLTVAIDIDGRCVYEEGPKAWRLAQFGKPA